jgi:anti-sigma B factor antagonist
MPAHVAQARTIEDVTVAAQGDPRRTEPLELSHRIGPAGEALVNLRGELDIATAEAAVSYVRNAIDKNVIDHHSAPLTVDLTALAFCDARGLAALLRMADYAEQAGCPFRLASPRPSLVKIMRITGLDRRFLVPQASAQLIPEAHPDSLSRLPRDTAALPPDKSQTRSLRPHRLQAGAQRIGTSASHAGLVC